MGTGRARPRMQLQQRIEDERLVVDGERKEVAQSGSAGGWERPGASAGHRN